MVSITTARPPVPIERQTPRLKSRHPVVLAAKIYCQTLTNQISRQQTGLNIPRTLNGATATPDSVSSSRTLMLCHQKCTSQDAFGPG